MSLPKRPQHSVLWFASGRQGLHALFAELLEDGLETVWLPEYHCMSMVAPALTAGARAQFYGVTSELEPRIDTLADIRRGDAVVAVHYFGRPYDLAPISKLCREREAVLVEDAAHVDLTVAKAEADVGQLGDYVLSCPRKFYSIYDGAMLIGDASTLRRVRQRWPTLREQTKGLAALMRPPDHKPRVVTADETEQQAESTYVDPRFVIRERTRATLASRMAWA